MENLTSIRLNWDAEARVAAADDSREQEDLTAGGVAPGARGGDSTN